MGVPLNPWRSAATALLLALPVVVLIVPQGTIERSLVPELVFVGAFLLTFVLVLAQAAWHTPAFALTRRQFHPHLIVVLVFFLLLNPMWSLWQGNEPTRVLMTALPFLMLGVYYLFALRRIDAHGAHTLLLMLSLSGVVLALVVVGNFLLSDLSASAMRSTSIEGKRTLTLPLLPMGGVLLTAQAFAARRGWKARALAGAAILVVVAIMMTVTRAMLLAYLAGAAVAVVALVWHGDAALRRRTFQRALAGLAAVGVLTAPLLVQWLDRINPASEGDVGTILGRLDEYSAFTEAFLSSPLLGRGMGHLVTYPSDFDFVLRDIGITVCHSHLFFLAGTTGIVGMALYYALLGSGLADLWRHARRVGGDAARLGSVAGIAGAAVAGILFTLTSTTFTTLSYNLFLAAFLFCARTDWIQR